MVLSLLLLLLLALAERAPPAEEGAAVPTLTVVSQDSSPLSDDSSFRRLSGRGTLERKSRGGGHGFTSTLRKRALHRVWDGRGRGRGVYSCSCMAGVVRP